MNAQPNPLYVEMERLLAVAREQINELRAENAALAAERNIFEDRYREAYNDRIRLQQIAASLNGKLQAIQAVIHDAVREAVQAGVEAAQEAEEPQGHEWPPGLEVDPAASRALSDVMRQGVDWSKLPQGKQLQNGSDQHDAGAGNQG